ncbi:MAG: hypothetical protein ACLT6Z_17630 [Coprobacillus cateniformis]|uniref:hypothetical protein n=1 Tax=Coprobacillus cateniformis TaxID=100884 RepID=UPI003995218B
MIGNKIKALLEIQQKSTVETCKYLNILQPAFSRKINNNTFKAEELIKLATFTNTKLAFVDKNNNPLITFDENDIKQENND